jgi:release factor glutamine methyltransferase
VPRPDTELIVEEALRILPDRASTVIDVGTGSGCLAVTLAAERPQDLVVATDISHEALLVARANARRHKVDGRLQFVRTDLASGLRIQADLIVSNPPYVPYRDAGSLPLDVSDYEPAMALFGGRNGLAIIERLLATLTPRLARMPPSLLNSATVRRTTWPPPPNGKAGRCARAARPAGIARTAVLERKRE